MTSLELSDQILQSAEHDYIERLNALTAAKPGGLIKNSDPEVRWKTMGFKVSDVSDQGIIDGMASGYRNLDSDEEVCLPGCFDLSLSVHHNPHPVVLWQHITSSPVGFHVGPGAGDPTKGLPVVAELMLDCEPGRYAHAFAKSAKKHNAKAGLSVGFRILKDTQVDGSEIRGGLRGKKYRGFVECSLLEYSLVTFPANSEAFVTDVKSQFEKSLRTTTYSIPILGEKSQAAELSMLSRKEYYAMAAEEKTTPTTFTAALAQATREDQMREDRWKLEEALGETLGSILNSDLDSADMKMQLMQAYTDYGNAMVSWQLAMISDIGKALKQVAAIKGMSTQQHVEAQNKLGKARVHMQEKTALQKMATEHERKAHGYISDVVGSYTANDINAPNPAGKSEGEQDGKQKDLRAAMAVLFKSLE